MTLPAFLQQAPPTVAVDIAPGRVVVTRIESTRGAVKFASHSVESLPDGAVTGALASRNMPSVGVVARAIERAWATSGGRPRQVCLVVPDSVARVSLVKFETVPARASDLDELIRWQVKKTTPFPLDEAVLTHTPGQVAADGQEFVVSVARRDVIDQYEQACTEAGAHAGVVDLATFNVVNAVLASDPGPTGDWLLVHAANSYVSLAVLRDGHVIFYRTRGEETDGSVADLVHQTAMYFEDRLGGTRFARVLLAGGAIAAGADALRVELSERLGLDVTAVDPFRTVRPVDRGSVMAETADLVAPGIGILMRNGRGA